MLKTKSFVQQVQTAKIAETQFKDVNGDTIEESKIAFKREILDVESKLLALQRQYDKATVTLPMNVANIVAVRREYKLTELYLDAVKDEYNILFPETAMVVSVTENTQTDVKQPAE